MKTITAGDTIKIKVEAKDDQSGIKSVCVEATNLRDLLGGPTFEVTESCDWSSDNNCTEVTLVIPEYIPSTKWKISGISLVNGTGREIKYSPSKDFSPILFNVKAKEGVDLTPAELISVSLIE
ncbi:MAG: hypothetical protein AB7V50_11760 [Vampirovibrionia bacterium]